MFSRSAKVLEIHPRQGDDAIKPAELIQITGHQELTLNARRAITILWHHAHIQGVEGGKDYTIELDRLKPLDHKGNEMVEEAIEALMRTLIVVRLSGGITRRVQFLGGNDLDDPDRPDGTFTFSFDKRLVEILKDSTIWGKISIPVLMAFTSKYSVSLYENIAKLFNLSHKTTQKYTLDEFREMLGVQPGKYKTFGELNKHVIKPVVREINALAGFNINLLSQKTGRRVTHISIGWWTKSPEEDRSAWDEVRRHKVGRKARISGHEERVISPRASIVKQVRSDTQLKANRKRTGKNPSSS